MIHLDANFLIGSVDLQSPPSILLRKWLQEGETFAASSVAWAEFLNGPVRPDQIQIVEILIQSNILSFGRKESEVSSQLFNRAGRKRGSQPDCFIAATAICARVPLATRNTKDFQVFVPLGLKLV